HCIVTVAHGTRLASATSTIHSLHDPVPVSSGSYSTDTVFAIAVTDVAPSSPADNDGASGGSVAEGAANGTAVGITAHASDVNGGSGTDHVGATAGGGFGIKASAGRVTGPDG